MLRKFGWPGYAAPSGPTAQGWTPLQGVALAIVSRPFGPSEIFLLFFSAARVVARVHVLDRPRPRAVELKNGLALGPDEVFHPRLPVPVSAGGHGLRRGPVESLPHADVERAGNDRHPFGFRVRVRRHPVALGELQAEDERSFPRRVS